LLPLIFTDVAIGVGRVEPMHDALIGSARSGEPDRYLAALLAPAAARADLLAVAAFSAELARVAHAVTREPAMADLRWQWWRDAVRLAPASATGHPIADHLRAAIERHGLAPEALLGLIDARSCDLEPMPFADDAALEHYFDCTEGTLFALSVQILGGANNGSDQAWSGVAAGRAYGLARLLLGLHAALARGHVPLPQTRLAAAGCSPAELLSAPGPALAGLVADLGAQARRSLDGARLDVTKLPREATIAVLPLALVESYLRASEGAARTGKVADIAPLSRIVRIAWARWLGRW
jgi:phytoene/squalene synthetase